MGNCSAHEGEYAPSYEVRKARAIAASPPKWDADHPSKKMCLTKIVASLAQRNAPVASELMQRRKYKALAVWTEYDPIVKPPAMGNKDMKKKGQLPHGERRLRTRRRISDRLVQAAIENEEWEKVRPEVSGCRVS